jgi:flagellar biosynthetic protein FlhB
VAEDQGQERTEPATPKRLREAREKGQVARSRELSTFAVMVAGSTTLLLLGAGMAGGMQRLFDQLLRVDRAAVFEPGAMTEHFAGAVLSALATFTPFLVLVALAAVLAPLAISGWTFSVEAISFKWEKLDPIKGLGRVFSWRGLMELFKALAKFTVVAVAALLILRTMSQPILGLGAEPIDRALSDAAALLGWGFLGLSLSLLLVVLVDVPFQIWNHARELKMTRQEVRDELKETEGRPEVRGRIRSLQREMAQRRMMAEVPKADVIVTNPTHYAVALRYEAERHGAPLVVAKGMGFVAEQIRRIGTESGVVQLQAPPLARAIYHSTELGQPIPNGLYLAVAQVLAYVYELRRARAARARAPEPPRDLPIPDELQRDW